MVARLTPKRHTDLVKPQLLTVAELEGRLPVGRYGPERHGELATVAALWAVTGQSPHGMV